MLGRIRVIKEKKCSAEPIVVDDRRFVDLRQAGVEDAKSAAHDKWPLVANRISETNSRRKIVFIGRHFS